MSQTVIAMFDSQADALKARAELVASGFSNDDIEIRAAEIGSDAEATAQTSMRSDHATHEEGGIGGFFRRLFGMDESDSDVSMYSEAYRRGNCILSVHTDEADELQQAEAVLARCGAIDIDERAAQWRSEGWNAGAAGSVDALDSGTAGSRVDIVTADARATTDTAGQQTIPVVEEQMQIGKRAVRRGGIRVYTRVLERPVEESVALREEHATIERRPVNRSATDADLAGMREGTIEVTETAEEPVVAKEARVVEEIAVGKEATQRTETVRGTVRKTDVQVEKVGERASASDESLLSDDRPGTRSKR